MSYVTNIVLHLSILEEDDPAYEEKGYECKVIKDVNAFFTDQRPLVGLHNTELLPRGWYGGQKYLECRLYVGAFNYLDLDGFLKHLKTVKFAYPEEVQVWIKDQHDEHFRLVQGIEETDPRIQERDNLLSDAKDWLEDLEAIYAKQNDAKGALTFGWELGQIRGWLERYKQLRGEDEPV